MCPPRKKKSIDNKFAPYIPRSNNDIKDNDEMNIEPKNEHQKPKTSNLQNKNHQKHDKDEANSGNEINNSQTASNAENKIFEQKEIHENNQMKDMINELHKSKNRMKKEKKIQERTESKTRKKHTSNAIFNQQLEVVKEYPEFDKKITSNETLMEAIKIINQKLELKEENEMKDLIIRIQEKGTNMNLYSLNPKIIPKIFQFIVDFNFNTPAKSFELFKSNMIISLKCIIFLQNLPKRALNIGQGLFKMAFYNKTINNFEFPTFYPVLSMADTFLNQNKPVISFSSSTGSGKTRLMPFIFAIRSILERNKFPFIIMSQPGRSFAQDKVNDFKKFFNENDVIIMNESDIRKYKKKKLTKPVIGIFSPIKILQFIKTGDIDIKKTRFILDEVHERPITLDVLVAELGKMIDYKSMQIMLMTATPDKSIAGSFQNQVKQISLNEASLFPIDKREKTFKKSKDMAPEVVNSLFEIFNEFLDKEIEKGHVVIFTSGNSRIIDISTESHKSWNKWFDHKKDKIALLNISEETLSSETDFNEQMKRMVVDQNKIYVLLIPYSSYRSENQKKIAKFNIKGYPNVIKVVIATDAIESSITIDDLVAVIDCGICNVATYNQYNGVTSLHEEPISE